MTNVAFKELCSASAMLNGPVATETLVSSYSCLPRTISNDQHYLPFDATWNGSTAVYSVKLTPDPSADILHDDADRVNPPARTGMLVGKRNASICTLDRSRRLRTSCNTCSSRKANILFSGVTRLTVIVAARSLATDAYVTCVRSRTTQSLPTKETGASCISHLASL